MSLPNNFYWGGSASSFQAEGAWDEGGKGLSIYDVRPTDPRFSDWKVGIDFYHRYKEDIGWLKKMGCNFYRFSIAWARVIPNGDDEPNEEGLQFYDNVINELIANGITPMICMYHFDTPNHLEKEYNGFASRYVVDCFERYARLIMTRYGDRVKHWMTFNEQNLHSMGLIYSNAERVPEGVDPTKFLYQVNHNVFLAHCKAVKVLREVAPDAQICGMIAATPAYPETCCPDDVNFALRCNDYLNYFHASVFATGKYPEYMVRYLTKHGWMPDFEEGDDEILSNTVDYLAFSYYQSQTVKAQDFDQQLPPAAVAGKGGIKNPYVQYNEWGWAKDAVGLRTLMHEMYYRFGKPIFILENGVGCREELPEDGSLIQDDERIEYHKNHIIQMKKAIEEDGVNCLGYITWGPIDILSSHCEMAKRYGFVFVNRTEKDLRDLRRVPKKSFYWVQKVFGSNGEELDG